MRRYFLISRALQNKTAGVGLMTLTTRRGVTTEDGVPHRLYVAPHGSCLLFQSPDALFQHEMRLLRGGEGADESGDGDGNEYETDTSAEEFGISGDSGERSSESHLVPDNVVSPSSSITVENATANFFLNQPATDEGACGLDDAWSSKEKKDLATFIKRCEGGEPSRVAARGGGLRGPRSSSNSEDNQVLFDPSRITRVVDMGCGTGRFSVMWPRVFAASRCSKNIIDGGGSNSDTTAPFSPSSSSLKEIVLVEPCLHFLEAAVRKMKAEYAWEEEREEGFGSRQCPSASSSSFGVPPPIYSFRIFIDDGDGVSEEAVVGSADIGDESNGVAFGMVGNNKSKVKFNFSVGNEKSQVAAEEFTGGGGCSDAIRGCEQQRGSRRGRRGRAIRVVCYQLTVDEYKVVSDDRRRRLDIASSAGGQQHKQDSSKKEHCGGILITTGVVQYLTDDQLRALPLLERWTLMKEDISMATVCTRDALCAEGCGGGGDRLRFIDGSVKFAVPVIADYVAAKIKKNVSKTDPPKEADPRQRKGETVKDEAIPVALCYPSDAGIVRTLEQFEAILGPIGTVRADASKHPRHDHHSPSSSSTSSSVPATHNTRRKKEENGYSLYHSAIQWDMPDSFYSPLGTWLMRRE